MELNEVLAVIGGHVEHEVLLRNEYLAVENEILRSRLGKLRLTDQERIRLAKIAKQLGRKALEDAGPIFKPDTIFKWYRQLIAKKFDSSKHRRRGGRPPVDPEIDKLVIRLPRRTLAGATIAFKAHSRIWDTRLTTRLLATY